LTISFNLGISSKTVRKQLKPDHKKTFHTLEQESPQQPLQAPIPETPVVIQHIPQPIILPQEIILLSTPEERKETTLSVITASYSAYARHIWEESTDTSMQRYSESSHLLEPFFKAIITDPSNALHWWPDDTFPKINHIQGHHLYTSTHPGELGRPAAEIALRHNQIDPFKKH
jgi:hypothetical protein